MILDYLTVESVTEIAGGIFRTVLSGKQEIAEVVAGQFMNIYPKNPSLTLPRPISICDSYDRRLVVVFKVVGKGTEEFSAYVPGERVKAMYPLGNGYSCAGNGETAVIIGGGIGAPPMLLLAKQLKQQGRRVAVFLGFQEEAILIDEFKEIADETFVSTETGSYGEKGNVLDLLRKYDSGGFYYACGPSPMLKAVCGYISENGRDGQISLEQRMACGFGACVGCSVKIKAEADWQYLKVCKDGPVFNVKEVLWD